MSSISADTRNSGIPVVGELPWGSHFCQFYTTQQDMVDIVVPYFRAGPREQRALRLGHVGLSHDRRCRRRA